MQQVLLCYLRYYKMFLNVQLLFQVLEDQLSLMQSDVKKEMRRSGTAKELFTGRQYRKAILISIGNELILSII